MFIPYDDNHYTTGTSKKIMIIKRMKPASKVYFKDGAKFTIEIMLRIVSRCLTIFPSHNAFSLLQRLDFITKQAKLRATMSNNNKKHGDQMKKLKNRKEKKLPAFIQQIATGTQKYRIHRNHVDIYAESKRNHGTRNKQIEQPNKVLQYTTKREETSLGL